MQLALKTLPFEAAIYRFYQLFVLRNSMTFQKAKALFNERFWFDKKDGPEAAQAWCIFIDTLHRDGKITTEQVRSWVNPFH